MTCARRGGAVTAVLAAEQAARQRAPHQDAHLFVDRQRDELVLGLAVQQGVVDLLADVPLQPETLRRAERLHEVPGRVVGAPDVADLAVVHEGVEGVEDLLHRRHAVPLVHLVEVDVVGAQAPQARLARPDEVMAGEPGVVGTVAHGEARLGGDQDVLAPALEDLAHDLLGTPGGVDVRRVDQVDAGLERLVDQGTRLRRSPRRRWAAPAPASPNVIVPRVSADTRSPLRPSCRYSTANPPFSSRAPLAGPLGSLPAPGAISTAGTVVPCAGAP